MSKSTAPFNPDAYLRQYSMLYSLYSRANWLIVHRKEKIENFPHCPSPMTVFLIISLASTAITLVSLWIIRPEAPETVLFHLYLGLLLFVVLMVPEMTLRRVMRFVATTETVEFRSRELWIKMQTREWTILEFVCAVAGAFIASYIVPFVYISLFRQPFFEPLYLPTLFIGALWGLGGVIALKNSLIFAQEISKAKLKLYVLNPRRSREIVAISQIFETALLMVSISLFVLILPIFRPSPPIEVVGVLGAIALFGLIAMFLLLFYAQTLISRVIARFNEGYLRELQRRISKTLEDAKTVDEAAYKQVESLAKLHDQIVGAESTNGLTGTRLSYYIRAFILPIGALLLNGSEIYSGVAEIIKQIFTTS